MAQTQRVVVSTGDGQYRLEDSGQLDAADWIDSVDGLTTGQDGWMAVLTGMEWGDLDVTVDLLTDAPSTVASGWETIAERSLRITGEAINLLSSTLTLQTALPVPTPGWYTVRVHATGRMSRLPKTHAPSGEEEHYLQIWPSAAAAASTMLTGPDAYGKLFLGG